MAPPPGRRRRPRSRRGRAAHGPRALRLHGRGSVGSGPGRAPASRRVPPRRARAKPRGALRPVGASLLGPARSLRRRRPPGRLSALRRSAGLLGKLQHRFPGQRLRLAGRLGSRGARPAALPPPRGRRAPPPARRAGPRPRDAAHVDPWLRRDLAVFRRGTGPSRGPAGLDRRLPRGSAHAAPHRGHAGGDAPGSRPFRDRPASLRPAGGPPRGRGAGRAGPRLRPEPPAPRHPSRGQRRPRSDRPGPGQPRGQRVPSWRGARGAAGPRRGTRRRDLADHGLRRRPRPRPRGPRATIAREIVARHDGALRVEEGPGCRVVVELPAHGPAGETR